MGPRLRFLKAKPKVSSCMWLNYNTSWIPNLAKYVLLKWSYWLRRNDILKSGMRIYMKIPMKLGCKAPKFRWVLFAYRRRLSNFVWWSQLFCLKICNGLPWPCQTLLFLIRIHSHYPTLFLDLYLSTSRSQRWGRKYHLWERVLTHQNNYMMFLIYTDSNLGNMG